VQLLQVWQAGALLHHQRSSAAAAVASAATSAAAASLLPAEPLSFSDLLPVFSVDGPVRLVKSGPMLALKSGKRFLSLTLLRQADMAEQPRLPLQIGLASNLAFKFSANLAHQLPVTEKMAGEL